MKLRVQLHLHTTESRCTRIKTDSIIKPKQVIDLARKYKIDAIAVTDHDTTSAIPKMKKYAQKNGIVLINGIEASTKDGHLIGLGVEERIEDKLKRSMSALEVSDVIKECGGEVYIPHPFDVRDGLKEKVKEVDGIIEVFNSFRILNFEDKLANLAATKLKRPKAVGGDAHIPSMINRGITVVDAEPDEISILKAIKKGRVDFENCTYIGLKEIKEWAIDRVLLSYNYIKDNISNGWKIDRWYMRLANLSFMRRLESSALKHVKINKKNRVWDILGYLSYSLGLGYCLMKDRKFTSFVLNL